MVPASCALLILVLGCIDPAAEMNQIRQQFDQIGPRADRRAVAFVLGLPYAETKDRSAWLYFRPPQGPLEPARPHRMIMVRFDKQDQCVLRELMLWRQASAKQIELHYELTWTDPTRPTDNDLPAILHEKLRELAQADAEMHLDSQPASYQFRAGEKLLIGMQRWEQGNSRMVRLSALLTDDSYPRVAEAVELSCRVRVLSAGIEFDRPLVQELR